MNAMETTYAAAAKRACIAWLLVAASAACGLAGSSSAETGSISMTFNGTSVCSPSECAVNQRGVLNLSHSFAIPSEVVQAITPETSVTVSIDGAPMEMRLDEDINFSSGDTMAVITKKVKLDGSDSAFGHTDIRATFSWAKGRFNVRITGIGLLSVTEPSSMFASRKDAMFDNDIVTTIENGAAYFSESLKIPVAYSQNDYFHAAANGNMDNRSIGQIKGSAKQGD